MLHLPRPFTLYSKRSCCWRNAVKTWGSAVELKQFWLISNEKHRQNKKYRSGGVSKLMAFPWSCSLPHLHFIYLFWCYLMPRLHVILFKPALLFWQMNNNTLLYCVQSGCLNLRIVRGVNRNLGFAPPPCWSCDCAPYSSRGKRNSVRFGSKSQIGCTKDVWPGLQGDWEGLNRTAASWWRRGQWGEILVALNFSFAIYVPYLAIQVPYRQVAESQRRHSGGEQGNYKIDR